MPTIELAKLKIQAAHLAQKFDDPEAFIRDLNELLGFYTNHSIRAAQVAQRLSMASFHTPRPVLRQIELELDLFADKQPAEGASLAETLWDAKSLESRLLAAYLLGRIPSIQAIPVLLHLPDWLNQSADKEIQTALLTNALVRLRRENPLTFFNILEEWLRSAQTNLQKWGLQALIPLLQDPQFENLPAVFRILRPVIRNAGPATQLDLQACLAALEGVSLVETVAFLRETIQDEPAPMMLRILLRTLPALSQPLQEALRPLLREQNTRD